MRASRAEALKADMVRAMLKCRCGHQQTEHLHSIKEGMIVGRWLQCLEQGCRCQAFLSCLTARELVDMEKELDRRVETAQVAAIISKQPPKVVGTPRTQFPVSKPPKYNRKARRAKERVKSADTAAVSGFYKHGVPTKLPNGKYLWEEL